MSQQDSTTPAKKKHEEKVWTPYFIFMVAILFFSYLCFHGLNTGTSVYIEIKGGSTVLSGILAAIYSTTAGIIRMVVGPIVDRRGRTVVMMAGASFFVASALLVGFMQDTTALVIGRILQGIGFGSIVTSATTAASDMLPSSRMGEGLSYFAIGSALSQAVGPVLALGMVALNPPEIMYYVLACVAAVVFILALICDYEKHPERLSVESAFRQRCEAAAESSQQSTAEMLSASQEEYTGIKRFVEPAALSGAIPMMCMNAGNAFPCFFVGLYGVTALGLTNTGAIIGIWGFPPAIIISAVFVGLTFLTAVFSYPVWAKKKQS